VPPQEKAKLVKQYLDVWKHPLSRFVVYGFSVAFREAGQRFLFLFLEKEECYWKKWLILSNHLVFFWGQAPKPPWFRFAEGLGW
jgi:hypothetical protein